MLIANIVGKDEADRYLEEVLYHLHPIADLIVFTDDGSTDKTPEIASKYATVYRNEESLFSINEGELRSRAWNNLSIHASPGDWILAIDCDEKLWCTRRDLNLAKLMNQQDYDVLNIQFYHMWDETHFRADKAWAPGNSSRMFRFFYGGTFKDRKLACGSEPSYVQTLIKRRRYMADSGLIMQHLGYMRDDDKKIKFDRYMELDGGDFHSRAHIESILDPNPTLIPWGT
jgi:glycosyltransferase involved in cell wall biosynthesis